MINLLKLVHADYAHDKELLDVEFSKVTTTAKTTMGSEGSLISLFCGAGGLDLGFHQEGFESILALDNNSSAVESFNSNFPFKAAVEADLGSLRTTKFMELVESVVSRTGFSPSGVIGGPPCQGVSNSNSGANPSDPRNSLMTTYLRLLNALEARYQIDFFVFENVPGLLNEKNSTRFKRLKRELAKKFHVTVQKVDAADFGVPQHRDRVLICGMNRKHFDKPMPSLVGRGQPKKSVRDAISSLAEPTYFSRGIDPASFPEHPNHWTMNPKSAKFKQQTDSVGRSFRKLDWDKPSKTVAYGHREIHIHPEGHRRLSIYEGLLLQGFPKTFHLKGTLSAQVQQVSNAVPPPLARSVAAQIKTAIGGKISDEHPGHIDKRVA